MPTAQGTLSSGATRQKHLIPALICLALAILTVITFWSLKDCGFVNFDDSIYVYENAHVQSGLNVNSVGQAFSSELAKKIGFWHPVTWLSYMLDYSIFGLNPQGYHLINLLFHVMNTLLLFLVFRRMTKALWPSAFVAALFAIHPLHVESVAWIAERKDVLSAFFWMLTLGAYSYYVENRGFRRYFFVLLFFILGLMAKSMLITIPFVLLLLDYWPLQRFEEIKPERKVQPEVLKSTPSDKSKKKSKKKNAVAAKETLEVKKPAVPEYKWSLIYPLLWEKVPLFVLTILFSIITYIAELKKGAVHSELFPLGVRIGNAFISYITYIGKMIWPSNLAVFYPYPKLLVPWQVLGSVFLFITITLVVIWRAKRSPYLATGWLWYIGTLVPVIGIVQVGGFAMADRYTYIPLIGLFIMVAWGVPDLLKKWKYRKEILLALSALGILCLSIITWTQVGYWQNNFTLYDHTLKVTDDNCFIYNCRGSVYKNLGNYTQAMEDYNKAIEIKPDYAHAFNNRGNTYGILGNYTQAVEDLTRAIEIKPDLVEAYFNRGIAYNGLGNYRKAIEDYSEAISLKADSSESYYVRGTLYGKQGQYQLALEDFNKAIRLNPDYIKVYNNRGNVYSMMGIYQKALEDFNEAIRLKSDYVDAYYNRARVYLNHGDKISGCRDARKACELGNCTLLEIATGRGVCR
jgi:tetratricopeptide (TPR) repeat protein